MQKACFAGLRRRPFAAGFGPFTPPERTNPRTKA
jgi:hypothetical protein